MSITNIISKVCSSHYNRKREHPLQMNFQLEYLQETASVSLQRFMNKFQDFKN